MKKLVKATDAPAAIGPYNHAIVMGDMIFTSGQLGIDPKNGRLVSGVEEQAMMALKNLQTVLSAAGFEIGDVVKTTVFVTDLSDFGKVNNIYGDFFGGDYPARSCVQVAALPAGGLVEVEAIAIKGAANKGA